MGINAISGVSSHSMSAVNAVSFGGTNLSAETLRRLKELGIDPAKVQSEAQAQELIKQAEQQKAKEQQTSQVQPQASSPNVDMQKLDEDVKALCNKLGVDSKTEDRNQLLSKLYAGVKEFVKGASAQSNISDTAMVKLSNGKEIKGNAQQMQADFNSIKERFDELDRAKNQMFAGQDMLAMMNRMALGI